MIYTVTNGSELKHAVSVFEGEQILAVDTETTGLDPLVDKVLLLQIGNENDQAVFDVYRLGTSIYDVLELVTNPDIVKVYHNARFDYKMLKRNFNIEPNNLRCTMIGEQLLNQGKMKVRYGLADVAMKYVSKEIDKSQQSSFIGMKYGDPFTKEQLAYAAEDTEYLIPIYRKIQDLLDERGMGTLSELEFETIRAIGDMELNGIYVDRDGWLSLKNKAQAKADEYFKELSEIAKTKCQLDLFGEPVINYNSPKQLLPLVISLTGANIKSTGEEILSKINHPFTKTLLKYRSQNKLAGTYGQAFLDENTSKVDGRIHSNIDQMKETGRLGGRTPNLMNIPKEQAYRTPFCAQDPEYKIISSDYAQQELRALAQMSKEPKFLYALQNNMDLHAYSASLIYNIPYKDFFNLDKNGDITFDKNGEPNFIPEMKKKYRGPCKNISFGIMYGMGPKKLANDLGISLQAARTLLGKYFREFPLIKKLFDSLAKNARVTKIAVSELDGRCRDLNSFDWDNSGDASRAERIAKNLPFQGVGASCTKLAVCRIKNRIDKENIDAMLVNIVHDELLYEVHEAEAEKMSTIIAEEMIKAFNFYAPDVPMAVSPVIADHWVH